MTFDEILYDFLMVIGKWVEEGEPDYSKGRPPLEDKKAADKHPRRLEPVTVPVSQQ